MLEKMQQSHFVKKYSVQFVNASGKLSAPFYFWDNKPHECSQTWQVVRSEFDKMMLDNAREHGVDAHEGVHVLEVLFEGERAVGVRIKDADGVRRDVHAKVVVDAQRPGRAAAEPLQASALGSGPQQGRDLDLLGRRLPRHRPRRGRDHGAADAGSAGLVLVHPAARQHRQRRRRRAVRLPVQGPWQPRTDLSGGSGAVSGREAAARGREAGDRLLRDARLFISLDQDGRRRLGAGRRRVWVSRPAVFVGRASRAQVGRACG